MPVQPMLPELEPRRHTAPPAPLRSPTHGVSAPAPVWLQRLSLVVFVLFCFYIGGLLAVLPWSQSYWEHNGWLLAHPALNSIVQRGWVRGVISGIGLMDLWIAVSELLHYRDFRPTAAR